MQKILLRPFKFNCLQPKKNLWPHGTDNLQAYKLYIAAMTNSLESGEKGYRKIDYIKKVIQLDSNFAAAHAYLGELYSYSASWFFDHELSNQEAYELAKKEFEIAIRLNPYEEAAFFS